MSDQVLNAKEINDEINRAETREEESKILNSTISEVARAYSGLGNRAERRRMAKALKQDIRKRRRNEKV